MVRFVIHKKNEECYYVALLNVDGDIILRGHDCSNLPDCKFSIDLIRNHALDFTQYELADSHEGKCFFKLMGSDGKEIAQSAIFETAFYAFSGIELIIRNMPFANIIDHRFVA